MTSVLEAPATLRPPRRPGGYWTWIIPCCPHCKLQHTHGAPKGLQDTGGSRVPHCDTDDHPPTYRIVPMPADTSRDAA